MHIVSTASGHLKDIAADRIRHHLAVLVPQNASYAHMVDAVIFQCRLGHNKSAIDKCFFRAFPRNLVTFCQLITLVNKAMIGSDDKMIGVAADGDSMNQVHDFLNGLLTRIKHLILGICLVSTRVNLIMIYIDNLTFCQHISQLCHFQIFDIIELYTDTIRVIALQHLLPTCQIIAKDTICQYLKIIRHFQCLMRQKCCHTEPRIRRKNTQLYRKFCRAFRVILHSGKQFLSDLVTHGIRNDDHGAFLGIAQVGIVKLPLQRNCRKCGILLNSSIPGREQASQIFVCVDIFHQFPKRLKAFRALQLVVIIVEFPILLIHIVIRSKISVDDWL